MIYNKIISKAFPSFVQLTEEVKGTSISTELKEIDITGVEKLWSKLTTLT